MGPKNKKVEETAEQVFEMLELNARVGSVKPIVDQTVKAVLREHGTTKERFSEDLKDLVDVPR